MAQTKITTAARKRMMIEALEKSLGIVTSACLVVGITRRMHYYWMQNDEKYRQAVEGIEDIALDFAESQLHKQIKDQDTAATIFYLKTKGKKRGYVEHSTIDLTSKGERINNSREEILAELELIRKKREETGG